MKKKLLLYACCSILCLGLLGHTILNASNLDTKKKVEKHVGNTAKPVTPAADKAVVQKPATSGTVTAVAPEAQHKAASGATQMKKAAPVQTAPTMTSTKTRTEQPNLMSKVGGLGNSDAEVYSRWQANGTATAEEKAQINRYLEGQRGHENRQNLNSQGGPDNSNYRWVDNLDGDTATFAWIELCGDVNASSGPTGDDASLDAAIGFSFPFYSGSYTTANISTNGTITLGGSFASFGNGCGDDLTGLAILMPYWEDQYAASVGGCQNAGADWIRYRSFGTYFVVEWSQISHFAGSTDRYSYQAILFDNGKIKFQYNTNWDANSNIDDATIGIDFPGLGDGLEYVCLTGPRALGTTEPNGRAVWFFQQAINGVELRVENLAPCGLNNINPAQSVSYRVRNVGLTASAASNAHFNYDNGTTLGTEALPVIAGGSFYDVTFATTINLTAGVHSLVGYIDSQDGNAANDTASCSPSACALPANDACENAVPQTLPANYTGTVVCASEECAGLSGGFYQDVWVAFTTTECMNVTISYCGSDPAFLNWYYNVMDNSCPCDGSFIFYNIYSSCVDGMQQLTFSNLPAGTYYYPILIYPANNIFGTYNIDISGVVCPPAPDNDNCGDVTPVTLPATFTGTTAGSTPGCSLLGWPGEVWHAFTIDECSNVTVEYCPSLTFNEVGLVLATDCPCENGSLVFANDFNSFDCGNGNYTLHFLNLPAGDYWLPIYNWSDSEYIIDVSAIACPPCIVDFTANVSDVQNYSNTSNTCGAGDDCALRAGEEQIYEVTVATAGEYTFSLCGAPTDWDTYLSLGTLCCGGVLAENDDFCGLTSQLTCVQLDVGTYFLRVEPLSNGSCGNYTLDITYCVPCTDFPANDSCTAAIVETLPHTYIGDFDCAHEECAALSGGFYQDAWIAFSIDECQDVTISFCGSDPSRTQNVYIVLDQSCPCSGSWIFWSGGNQTDCNDGQWTVFFPNLAAGTYYYPILNQEDFIFGGYNIEISGAPCGQGRCCYDNGNSCQNTDQANCATLGGTWTQFLTCESDTCTICVYPANDACENAVPQNLPASYTGTIVCAHEECASLSGGTLQDAWVAFTTTECMDITISFCGSDLSYANNSYIVLENACPCDGSFNFATNWDFFTCPDGSITLYFNQLPAGTWYYPILVQENVIFGDYQINISGVACPPPPENDNCAGVIEICSTPYNHVSTTIGALDDYQTCANTAPDVIYTFTTSAASTNMTISLCAGTNYDSRLELRSGGLCPGDTQIGCVDDFCGLQSEINSGNTPAMSNLPAGTYYVIVDGFASSAGNYTLDITSTPAISCCTPDTVDNLTVARVGLTDDVVLRWEADPTFGGVYDVYASTTDGGVGAFPGTYTLIASDIAPIPGTVFPGIGNTTYTHTGAIAAEARQWYRVVGRCP